MLEENDNIKRHEKKGLRPLHDQSKGRNTECYLAFLTPPLASSCTIKAGSVAVSPNSDTIVEVIGWLLVDALDVRDDAPDDNEYLHNE